MPGQALKSIDDYEVFLTEKLTTWSPGQRLALAAAIAERWLPAYESFSAENEWGDPASLRRSLDAVWGCVEGRALADKDLARHIGQAEDVTPHMDDFDAEDALTACAILTDALRACGAPDNTLAFVVQATLGVFEGLVQEWPVDRASQLRVWRRSAVRKELQAQLKLIDEIDAIATLDADSVKALRSRVSGVKVKVAARPKPAGPPGLTNQTAFEQYRRMVESDLKSPEHEQPPQGFGRRRRADTPRIRPVIAAAVARRQATGEFRSTRVGRHPCVGKSPADRVGGRGPPQEKRTGFFQPRTGPETCS